jgi:hypothetical protein
MPGSFIGGSTGSWRFLMTELLKPQGERDAEFTAALSIVAFNN